MTATSTADLPRRDTLLKGAGQLMIGGFISGLESRYGAVKDSLAGLTSDIANTPMTSLTATVDTATLPRGRNPPQVHRCRRAS